MTRPAVLWVSDFRVPDGTVVRQLELDCAHATTTAVVVRGRPDSDDEEAHVIGILQKRHEDTCRCAERYVRGMPS
jgi:hypothetical protein